jgi:hypothetical protein
MLIAAVITLHLTGYRLPAQPHRAKHQRDAAIDDRLAQHLLRTKTQAVIGSYWTTYPFAFLTRERVLGIPCRLEDDYAKMRERMPATPLRVAMIEESNEAPSLTARMQHANIEGNLRIFGRYALFEPLHAIDPQRAIAACAQ